MEKQHWQKQISIFFSRTYSLLDPFEQLEKEFERSASALGFPQTLEQQLPQIKSGPSNSTAATAAAACDWCSSSNSSEDEDCLGSGDQELCLGVCEVIETDDVMETLVLDKR